MIFQIKYNYKKYDYFYEKNLFLGVINFIQVFTFLTAFYTSTVFFKVASLQ